MTEKQVNVYNKKMKLRHTIAGLNIRGCVHIHNSYLYTISDAITRPPTVTDYRSEAQQDDNE